MHAITHIEPPIAFRRRNGCTAVLRDTDTLADWLDRIYDAILDPQCPEGGTDSTERSLQLHEIEQVLFGLAEETGGGAFAISSELRTACQALIARYRELIPVYAGPRARGPGAEGRQRRAVQ
ncbi:hypothetical protein [Inquilinus sp. OTU3971]|uniref:hypothetical protein n=1 Tax=Inquilinus sp. OTU3971 TaxID=3043855 RepID=UPI00313CFA1C